MWEIGSICLVGGYVLGLLTDTRARKLMLEAKGLLLAIEVRLANVEKAVTGK
jgi:proteasome assembly chaperone (PAC2) family protein